MNMKVLTASRKALKPGDIFVFQILPDVYHYGRIVKTDQSIGSMEGNLLVYFYRTTSSVKEQIPPLCRNDLLIPPQIINRLGWSRGYFETIAHQELTPDDMFPMHCFWDFAKRQYVDDARCILQERIEPCGDYGLGNHRTVDDEISKELGIPLSED